MTGSTRSSIRASDRTRAAFLAAALIALSAGTLPAAAVIPAPPGNDNFAEAQPISGVSGTWTGTNVAATCEWELGEPDHDDMWCEASVWLVWTAPSDGLMVIDTVGTPWDTVLAVYTGNYLPSLRWVGSNDAAAAPDIVASRVGPFRVTKGSKYKIAVDGPDEGPVQVNWALHPLPALAVGDASVVEGGSRTRNLMLPVTLSEPGDYPVSVDYTVANVTAGSGDITASAGTFSFPAGSTSRSITVGGKGDTTVEPNETFRVAIAGAVNASIVRGRGHGTILTDDPSRGTRIAIGDALVREGDRHTRKVYLAVTLSRASAKTVTFRYHTVTGTSRAADFVGESGRLSIPAGSLSAARSLEVRGDTSNEVLEKFTVEISNLTNAIGARTVGTVSVLDDDR